MALSGSIGNTFRTGYRLQIDWTATQDIANNQSTVTAKFYLISLGSSYTINSSATKNGDVLINGVSHTFSGAGLADLNGNQTKLLTTKTETIDHNADGTKTFVLDGWFDFGGISLGGTTYNTVNLSGTSFTLDTIPRKSTLTDTTPAFTALVGTYSIGISRKSSSFTHKIDIYVPSTAGSPIYSSATNVGTSHIPAFDQADYTTIFSTMAGASTCSYKIRLTTYNGGSSIGYNDYTGTITAPPASTVTITNPANVSVTTGQETSTVYIDQTINLDVNEANSALTHTINFLDGTGGATVKSLTGVTTATTSWTPTAGEQTALYNKTLTGIEFDGDIQVLTYYNGVQIRSATSTDINYRVRNSDPTLSSANISYDDSSGATTTITGSPVSGVWYIIQNKSTLRAYVNAGATFKNGATLKKYIITCGNRTQEMTTATGSVVLGTIDASTDQTLTVTVEDSRGNQGKAQVQVKMVKWSAPVATASMARDNKFDPSSTLKLNGTFERLVVNGVEKNTILNITYTIKEKISGTVFRTTTPITPSINLTAGTYNITNIVESLDSSKAYLVDVAVQDKLWTTNVAQITVPAGIPIMFIDSVKNSVGVGRLPTNSNGLELAGNLYMADSGGNVRPVLQTKVGDVNGIGVVFGGSGHTIVGAGEYHTSAMADSAYTGGTEALLLGADQYVRIVSNAQTYANKHELTFGTDAKLSINGDTIYETGTGFQTLTLINGATTNNSRTPRFTKRNGIVYLEGEISAGLTNNTTFATLPAGFRPNSYSLNFTCPHATATLGSPPVVSVSAVTGNLVLITSNGANGIALNNISFMAEV